MEQRANIKFLLQIGENCNRDAWNVGAGVREGNREHKMSLLMFETLSQREGNDWGWATFGSAIDKQNPGNDRQSATNADTRRLTLRLIAEKLGINKDMAHTIVRNDLGKRKICSRLVPHKRTDEKKAKRMETSGVFISMCGQDPLLLENIVTRDETWCYQFDPESKRQSMAWCTYTSPRPKKSRLQKSKVKTLLIAFCGNKGIICKEFVPAGLIINVTVYLAFWTGCYSVSGGFGQSCTGLENGCCSTIMSLRTVQSVCASSWLRRW